jgi:hypothetical protein
MTALRQRMIEELTRRNYGARDLPREFRTTDTAWISCTD